MGFSVQLALLRGRPPGADLERWVGTAMPRLQTARFPLLVAAGRIDEDAAPFTFVFFARLTEGAEAPPLEPAAGPVHDLPVLPGDLSDDVDPFLLTLALLAQADGVDAAFLVDSSISDCGSLVVASKPVVQWDADSADEGRERAEGLLRAVFGDRAPDLEELTWLGPAASFWQRRMPVAPRPSASGLFRRLRKP